jgi:mannose-6-phosphate isomerase-like protein (cupin superfamily)
MKLIVAALLCAGALFPASDPEGLHVWKAAELKGLSKALSPKLNGTPTAIEPLPGAGNFSFIKIYRNGTGQAEYHQTQADVFVVETGEATLVYGGELVDGKTTAEHEMRGSAIEGGMEKKLAPGDIVSIPAGLPHWVKVAPGKDIAYFIVKVTQ